MVGALESLQTVDPVGIDRLCLVPRHLLPHPCQMSLCFDVPCRKSCGSGRLNCSSFEIAWMKMRLPSARSMRKSSGVGSENGRNFRRAVWPR